MLGKLLKYDFKSLAKTMMPSCIAAIGLAILTRIMNMLADYSNLFAIPNGFISVMFVLIVIVFPVLVCIYTIVKFYQNLIKDEGYLMHTLPVSKHQLVLSKLISAVFCMGIACLISIAALFIGVYGIWFHNDIFQLIGEIWKQIDHAFFILLVIISIVGIVSQQFMVYASIALGQTQNNHKLGYAFVFGLGLYYLSQIFSLVLLVPLLFNPDYTNYMNGANPPQNFMNMYLVAALILTIILAVVYYIITVKVFEKKLNLD